MKVSLTPAVKFQGQVAIKVEDLKHADLPEHLEQTPWTQKNRPDQKVTVNLSSPDNANHDIGVIAGHLIANNIPFAYKPTSEPGFMHAADHPVKDLQEIIPHVKEGKSFKWSPEPASAAHRFKFDVKA